MADQVESVSAGLRLEAADVQEAMKAIFGTGDEAHVRPPSSPSPGIDIDPERVEHDLAKLVLTLMEFLRRLMELQAIRRMEAGALSDDEEEMLGDTLMRAHDGIVEMAGRFGLAEQDLTLDLGPIGKLM